MSPFEAALLGVLAPALVAGAVLLPGLRRASRGWLAAPAIAAGYVAGHLAIVGWPKRFPPLEARDWLPWLAIAAGILGPIAARSRSARVILWLLAAAALPWTLLQSYVEYQWSGAEAVRWLGGLGVVLFVSAASLHSHWSQRPGVLLPLTLTLVGTFTAICVALSGSALIGQLSGVLTAAFGALMVVAWIRPDLAAEAAAVPALVLLATLWLTGAFYADVPPSAAVLLALAPLAARTREWPPIANRSPRVATLFATGFVLLPLIAAVTIAAMNFEPAPEYDY